MVQVKKAEMRQTIIDVATDEFMKKCFTTSNCSKISHYSWKYISLFQKQRNSSGNYCTPCSGQYRRINGRAHSKL